MKKCRGFDPKARRVYPLRSWRRADVYTYLESRGIAPPPRLGRTEQGGLDFHPEALAALGDDDWARWERDFPFATPRRAQGLDQVKRSEMVAKGVSGG